MKYQRAMRTAVCAACVGAVICLAGCSISFCGLQSGGKDELVFACGEHPGEKAEPVAEDILPLQMDEQESLPVSEQPEEAPSEQSELVETEQVSGISGDFESGAAKRVNINTAGMEELMTLNGIGETRARAIVEYRTQNGTFTKVEDIMQVPGIKEGIFSKIQSQIAVD